MEGLSWSLFSVEPALPSQPQTAGSSITPRPSSNFFCSPWRITRSTFTTQRVPPGQSNDTLKVIALLTYSIATYLGGPLSVSPPGRQQLNFQLQRHVSLVNIIASSKHCAHTWLEQRFYTMWVIIRLITIRSSLTQRLGMESRASRWRSREVHRTLWVLHYLWQLLLLLLSPLFLVKIQADWQQRTISPRKGASKKRFTSKSW